MKSQANLATARITAILRELEPQSILNGKEILSFSLVENASQLPQDMFNIICDAILAEIETADVSTFDFAHFRDVLYDILVYNLDVTDCIWYILFHFVTKGWLDDNDMQHILSKLYLFLKYYNNNYRPIYHLESIFFTILIRIQTNKKKLNCVF